MQTYQPDDNTLVEWEQLPLTMTGLKALVNNLSIDTLPVAFDIYKLMLLYGCKSTEQEIFYNTLEIIFNKGDCEDDGEEHYGQ